MLAEPGATEGPAQAPKTTQESFYTRKEGSDLPSFAEATNKSTEIATNPEMQKVMQELGEVTENIAVQDAAVDLVGAYVNWVNTTEDTRVTGLLSGKIEEIVRRFAEIS
jgi:hypothetical protein